MQQKDFLSHRLFPKSGGFLVSFKIGMHPIGSISVLQKDNISNSLFPIPHSQKAAGFWLASKLGCTRFAPDRATLIVKNSLRFSIFTTAIAKQLNHSIPRIYP